MYNERVNTKECLALSTVCLRTKYTKSYDNTFYLNINFNGSNSCVVMWLFYFLGIITLLISFRIIGYKCQCPLIGEIVECSISASG